MTTGVTFVLLVILFTIPAAVITNAATTMFLLGIYMLPRLPPTNDSTIGSTRYPIATPISRQTHVLPSIVVSPLKHY